MKIAVDCCSGATAPAGSRTVCTSAFVSGADVLRLPVRLTADKRAVIAENDDVQPLTGQAGKISELSFADVRGLNFATNFKDASGNSYRAPNLKIESFPSLLDVIPADPWLLIELKGPLTAPQRKEIVSQVVSSARNRGILDRLVLYSSDADALTAAKISEPSISIGSFAPEQLPTAQVATAAASAFDAVILPSTALLDTSGGAAQPGPLVTQIRQLQGQQKLKLGAIAMVASGQIIDGASCSALLECGVVWAVQVDSVVANASILRAGWRWIDEKWDLSAADHEDVNANQWHLGYAKYNPEKYAHVYPDQGIHIKLAPFTGELTYHPTGDPVRDGMQQLLERTWESTKDWPFYSGGGVGFGLGIEGDFSAEVDIQSDTAQQATTVEMAAVNVDPATHRKPWVQDQHGNWHPNYPTSFRDKHTFFDPHGAPPFCGVEHDEDDGWRINWNLGNDYDSNQYGKPWGDGKLLQGRMRLDRRGAWFAAYLRPVGSQSDRDWMCVGVAENQALNPRVYLRLAGKRWRQEDPQHPSVWMPVIPNHFVFRNMTITRYLP